MVALIKRGALAFVLVASVALAQSPTPAITPTPSCPSFKDLATKLDRRIASLKPGTSFQEFTRDFAYQALDWEKPQSPEGALFMVGLSEGNASISDELQCRFAKNNLLISCRRECCRNFGREITLEQYDSLVVGELRAAVEARVCTPSDVERDGAKLVKTYYHIALPVGHHDEGQTVLLVFEGNRLLSKGMSPYY